LPVTGSDELKQTNEIGMFIPVILKKSVELNPAKNIQHKLDRPTAGMSFI